MKIIEGRDLKYEERLDLLIAAANRGLISHQLVMEIRFDYFMRGIVYGDAPWLKIIHSEEPKLIPFVP